MEQYRKKFRIADIAIQIDSESEFAVSDKYRPFEADFAEEDVCFHVRTTQSPDLSGFCPVYRSDRTEILIRQDRFAKVSYREDNPEKPDWCLYQNSDTEYTLYFYGTEQAHLSSFHFLYFLDLSGFLIRFQTMILHASVIRFRNCGIVFTAPSGTGKSTQADLWNRYLGAEVLNGDRAMIRREETYRVFGSTFAGSSGIYKNESAALTAIVVLRQAAHNHIRPMKEKEAYLCLLSELSVSEWNKETVDRQSEWLMELIAAVPVYLLECTPDQEAVATLYEAVKENFSRGNMQ